MMKTENNLGLNWLQVLQFPSAEFQQYIGRGFWFKASSARIPMIPTQQNCGFGNPTTWSPHPHSCFAVSPVVLAIPRIPVPDRTFPVAMKGLLPAPKSTAKFQDCPWYGKSSSQCPLIPHHWDAGGGLVGVFFDWIQVGTFKFKSSQVQEIS